MLQKVLNVCLSGAICRELIKSRSRREEMVKVFAIVFFHAAFTRFLQMNGCTTRLNEHQWQELYTTELFGMWLMVYLCRDPYENLQIGPGLHQNRFN